MTSDYEITIGLEIHCELKTATKIFCSCPNVFGGEPNTHCCPICSGFPGTMPVLNRKAVEYTVKAGLALGCEIARYSKWDRKNYFYPDLPKAWQTSQYDLPLCRGGGISFTSDNGEKRFVRLNRIHLEEDAGKLIHEGGVTRVDYNRCGVPLIEIVTEPDIHSPEDAVAFLTALKSIIKYTGVSDVKMQEGSLRCDVNLSVAKKGEPLGTRTETKNLNSFRAVLRSCKYEAERQIELIESGEAVKQETRRWDDASGVGSSMRGKEDAHDYRYFPEPDLMPVVMTDEDVEKIRATVPALPGERVEKYTKEYGLSDYDAALLTADVAIADLFDGTVAVGAAPKKAANFIMGDVMRLCKAPGAEDVNVRVSPSQLAEMLKLVDEGAASLAAVQKEILPRVWDTDKSPSVVLDELGLRQSNDAGELEAVVKGIIDANPKVVADYLAGNQKVVSFFVGQAMKATKGKANPKMVSEILGKLLK